MRKEDFTAMGLDEETAKKCAAASAEELKGFIPKARFDEVNTERKNLETALSERDKQLDELKNSAGDAEAFKKQIAELQEQNKVQSEQHSAEIHALKVDNAVEMALNGSKAKNHTAVKALLADVLKEADFNDDGTVKGLANKLKEIQKSDPYLFDTAAAKPTIKGAVPGESGVDQGDTNVDTSKMNYSELCAYLSEHPDVNLEQG